jgi:hypothetical protein
VPVRQHAKQRDQAVMRKIHAPDRLPGLHEHRAAVQAGFGEVRGEQAEVCRRQCRQQAIAADRAETEGFDGRACDGI